jgi:hypothetical protein
MPKAARRTNDSLISKGHNLPWCCAWLTVVMTELAIIWITPRVQLILGGHCKAMTHS